MHLLAPLALSLIASASPASADAAKSPALPHVVELFTSEGCSSCPSADKLLSELARDASKDNIPLAQQPIFLAFHVDYWNYLGWKDRFATAAASARQRAYAPVLRDRSGSVYTPQMVIDGRVSFVGSDSTQARRELQPRQNPAPGIEVSLTLSPRKAGEPIKAVVRTSDPARPAHILLALTEDALTTKVASGENSGRSLTHDRVVRAFAEADAADNHASFELPLPTGAIEANCRVVAIVTSPKDAGLGVVLGATQITLQTQTPAHTPSQTSSPAAPATTR